MTFRFFAAAAPRTKGLRAHQRSAQRQARRAAQKFAPAAAKMPGKFPWMLEELCSMLMEAVNSNISPVHNASPSILSSDMQESRLGGRIGLR